MSIKEATFSLCVEDSEDDNNVLLLLSLFLVLLSEIFSVVAVTVSLLRALLCCEPDDDGDEDEGDVLPPPPLDRRNSVGVLHATQHLDNPSNTANSNDESLIESTRITLMEVGWSTGWSTSRCLRRGGEVAGGEDGASILLCVL